MLARRKRDRAFHGLVWPFLPREALEAAAPLQKKRGCSKRRAGDGQECSAVAPLFIADPMDQPLPRCIAGARGLLRRPGVKGRAPTTSVQFSPRNRGQTGLLGRVGFAGFLTWARRHGLMESSVGGWWVCCCSSQVGGGGTVGRRGNFCGAPPRQKGRANASSPAKVEPIGAIAGVL